MEQTGKVNDGLHVRAGLAERCRVGDVTHAGHDRLRKQSLRQRPSHEHPHIMAAAASRPTMLGPSTPVPPVTRTMLTKAPPPHA